MKKSILLLAGAALLVLPAHANAQRLKGQNAGGVGMKRGKKAKTKAPPSNLTIKNVKVTSVNGNKIELALYLHKPGSRAKAEVQIDFVDGKRRHQLWKKSASFSGSRTGFKTAATIDVRGKNLRRGKLEVYLPGCPGKKKSKCRSLMSLNKGDLVLGSPSFERRGSQSILRFEVKNRGPLDTKNCKAHIKIDGKTVSRVSIGKLKKGGKFKLEQRFANNKKSKPYKVELKCKDLAPENNKKSGKLK